MREMMFCGTGSFKDVDKEEGAGGGGGKPAKAKTKASGKSKGKNSNPYASRGLDKFSVVLSELESKREKILRRAGSDVDANHLMVRFVQSEAKGWVPIVVKLPQEEEQQAKKRQGRPGSQSSTPPPTEPASPKEEDPAKLTHAAAAVAAAPAQAKAAAAPVAKKSKARGGVRWSLAWGRKMVMRPCHYWPLAMALLLLCLVVFGRVFAICCTSIWWYLLPILSGEEALVAGRPSPTTTTTAIKPRKDAVGIKAGDRLAVAPPNSHGKRSSSAGAAHEMIAHRKKG